MDLAPCYYSLGFKQSPFSITPDTELYFPNDDHVAALGHMQFGLHSGGFTLITGEVGLGKTLLCRELIKQCNQKVRTAYVFNPLQSINELLRSIYFDLTGQFPEAKTVGQLHESIYRELLAIAARGERAAIIIDEAHRLNPELLEALRLISNIETEKEKLLSLILVGQPELQRMLTTSNMRPLAQRISISYTLKPLTWRTTINYINHRLENCRLKGNFHFSPAAMFLAYFYSKGTPRRINQICDRALLAAYSKNRFSVDVSLLRKAVKEVIS